MTVKILSSSVLQWRCWCWYPECEEILKIMIWMTESMLNCKFLTFLMLDEVPYFNYWILDITVLFWINILLDFSYHSGLKTKDQLGIIISCSVTVSTHWYMFMFHSSVSPSHTRVHCTHNYQLCQESQKCNKCSNIEDRWNETCLICL